MNNDYIQTIKEWVTIEDYPLKILILTSVLADANLAFRGTLKAMCDWLQISNCTENKNNIKDAINKLIQADYIFCNIENEKKEIYHISIKEKALKDKKIIKIKKKYIEALKNFNIPKNMKVNKNWITLTKTLIALLDIQNEKIENALTTNREGTSTGSAIIVTMKEVGQRINKCEKTAGNLVKQLAKCDFDGVLEIEREVIKIKYIDYNGNKQQRTVGTYIEFNNQFEK